MNVKTIIVAGNFFCITAKELDLLKAAKAMGDILIVLIDSDEKLNKKNNTIFATEDKRNELVSELKCVDIVTIIDCSLIEVLQTVTADVLVLPSSKLLEEAEYNEIVKTCNDQGIVVELK